MRSLSSTLSAETSVENLLQVTCSLNPDPPPKRKGESGEYRLTPNKCYCFSLAESSNPLDDLIGDIFTDSTNLLGWYWSELNYPTSVPANAATSDDHPTNTSKLTATHCWRNGVPRDDPSWGDAPTGYHAPHVPNTSHAFHWMGLSQVWWRGRAIWGDARTIRKPDSNGQTWWDGDEHDTAACFATHDPQLQPSHGGRCPTI